MDVIRSLVQNLIVIIVLAMFLEMFLPLGEMRRYVKMVMGLLIIIAVIQAVGDLLHRDYTGDIPAFSARPDSEQLSMIMESGQKMSREQQEKAIEQYKKGLANQVVALAGMNKEIPVVSADVSVYADAQDQNYGQIIQIVLYLDKTPEEGQGENQHSLVSPVTVQVGQRPEYKETGGAGDMPPVEIAAPLTKTIANFYNLKPEQITCVYR